MQTDINVPRGRRGERHALSARPLLLLLMAVSFFLTGCLEVQVRIALREDGGGIVTWNMEILPQTAAAGMTAETLRAELEKNEHFRRPGVRFSQSRSARGNEVVTATVPFDDVSAISSNDMQAGFEKGPGRDQRTFTLRGLMILPMPVQVDVEMPGKILSTNADSVSGNTARFDSLFHPEGLYVQSEADGLMFGLGPAALGAAAGAALLAAILALVVVRRKLYRRPVAAAPPPSITAAPAEAVFCGECGSRNKSSARFCKNCGAPL